MKFKMSQLWRPEGTVGREAYLIAGLVLFGIKHNLDRILATVLFGRRWDLFNYWIPVPSLDIRNVSPDDRHFLFCMLVLSLPFIWFGVCLTLGRLRDVRLPPGLVVLFFLPFLNLLFFLILSVMPGYEPAKPPLPATGYRPSLLDRMMPDSQGGSAVAAILATLVIGTLLTFVGVNCFVDYGWGLFVGIPFCMGLLSVLIYGYHFPRPFWPCVSVSLLSVTIVGVALVLFAIEGIVCVLMAAPIAIVLALIGGVIGWAIQRRPAVRPEAPRVFSVLILAIPAIMGVEKMERPDPPLFEVKTSLIVNAPPEQVWKHVVSFTHLPAPTEWVFRTGIAYPTHAEIDGRGVGAIRRCNFSTGCFTEPIEVWDEPRLLRFSVTSNPPSMQEWTFYSDIHPPHVEGFMVSKRGQFLLTRLSDGRTRLEGTTWYQHGLWPSDYWRVWSDQIIHAIHLRVLNHVKSLSEKDENAPRQS